LIVTAKIKHLMDIYDIEQKMFSNPWTNQQIKDDILSTLDSENWVYINNNRVIGYILGHVVVDEYHLNNIAVHPNFIRMKIGTKLVLHVILQLKVKNIRTIYLEVSEKNIIAQRCYQSLGFIKVGLRKGYYLNGDDAILYNMDIVNNGRMVS
tara:strand:- start:400 stop:855 length:456 start_codon:yes stop_codon:yes gene_type:complete